MLSRWPELRHRGCLMPSQAVRDSGLSLKLLSVTIAASERIFCASSLPHRRPGRRPGTPIDARWRGYLTSMTPRGSRASGQLDLFGSSHRRTYATQGRDHQLGAHRERTAASLVTPGAVSRYFVLEAVTTGSRRWLPCRPSRRMTLPATKRVGPTMVACLTRTRRAPPGALQQAGSVGP